MNKGDPLGTCIQNGVQDKTRLLYHEIVVCYDVLHAVLPTVLIRLDHAALKWLISYVWDDTMYLPLITEMQGYLPCKVEYGEGQKHSNADVASQVYRDCKYPDCTDPQFCQNQQCHHEDSPDNEEDWRKDDDGDDYPDHNDYFYWGPSVAPTAS